MFGSQQSQSPAWCWRQGSQPLLLTDFDLSHFNELLFVGEMKGGNSCSANNPLTFSLSQKNCRYGQSELRTRLSSSEVSPRWTEIFAME
ncbi:hypothetical protein CDAR_283331 [Caerostris darwini]|uniref:C2 domain-containing protein n=1 Tax=Caerostris darwini TaxID=1538125 RepID=A0AAV4UEF4_9ARAC|nr:hypothetical protein CDAR_283331 [Caerostris darwini]